MTAALDLGSPRSIHLVGIAGAGISAIATVLLEMGHRVSGSDGVAAPVLDALAAAGATVHVGHDRAHLPVDLDVLAISTAVPADNPEVLAAVERGVPVLRRAELLAEICRLRRTVAVSGTHGKTTTSSLLAEVMVGAGRDVGFLVGARIAGLGVAARWGTDEVFVVEADESDGSAFVLPRAAAVVTNVEPDHLEHHGDFDALRASFDRFVDETDGPVVICADDVEAAALAPDHARRRTYGLAPDADVRIVEVRPAGDRTRWRLHLDDRVLDAELARPGLHNVQNATAAVAMAIELGVDPTAAVAALAGHRGVARRFEARGAARGVEFIDDYAHLPTEVAAALAAARSVGRTRVVAVFQPHRYSRTEALGASFADSFGDADVLVVTDVYPSGEAARPGVSGRTVLDPVLAAHPGRPAHYALDLDEAEALLDDLLQPGDLCITLGAGDLTTLPDRMLARWERSGA